MPAATGVISGIGERRDGREARLFDHRRGAYLAFSAQARSLLEATFQYFHGAYGHSDPDPEPDVLDPLLEAKALLDLYCTEKTSEAGQVVIRALSDYIWRGSSAEHYKAGMQAIDAYARQARADLGVRS